MTSQKHYASFDLLKAVSCIAVVLIHYNWDNSFGIAIKAAGRFAVPCFLFISGFFCVENNCLPERKKMIAKQKHTLSILSSAVIFYFFFYLLHNALMDYSFDPINAVQEKLTGARIVKLAVTNDPIFYAHLWYLFASIYIYTALIPIAGKKLNGVASGILCALLAAGFLCLSEFSKNLYLQTSVPLGEGQRLYFRNLFVFRALPFFLFGMWTRNVCSREKAILSTLLAKCPDVLFAAIAIFGMILGVVERRILGTESQFYIGSYITTIALCWWCVASPDMHLQPLNHIGRELSANIYILHIACGSIVSFVAKKCGLWGNKGYVLLRPFAVLALTLAVCEMIFIYKNGIPMTWKRKV